jgi:hypothetical protein
MKADHDCVRICGMQPSSMPTWESSHMNTSLDRSAQADASSEAAAQDAFTSEGGHVDARSQPVAEAGAPDQEAQARLMATLGIHHKGRYYHFRSYRYVRLEDAVAYARLVGTRAARMLPEDNLPSRLFDDGVQTPTGSDTALMQSLGVTFEADRYVYEGFHYDHLADAVAYARLRHSREA